MSRHSRIVHLSDSIADELVMRKRERIQPSSQKRDIPHELAWGLVLGLCHSFTRPVLRRRAAGIQLEPLVDCLLEWINTKRRHATTRRTRRTRTDIDAQVLRRLPLDVPGLMTLLLQHPSPYVLSLESKWLAQELTEYGTLPNVAKRQHWVRQRVRRLLRGLLERGRCPRTDCTQQTTVPTRDTLERWTDLAGSGVRELSFHILAYYHGSTYGTVKRRLRSRSSW